MIEADPRNGGFRCRGCGMRWEARMFLSELDILLDQHEQSCGSVPAPPPSESLSMEMRWRAEMARLLRPTVPPGWWDKPQPDPVSTPPRQKKKPLIVKRDIARAVNEAVNILELARPLTTHYKLGCTCNHCEEVFVESYEGWLAERGD